MERWADRKLSKAEASRLERVRETHPDFSFARFAAEGAPEFGATRLIHFEARASLVGQAKPDAVLSLHDGVTGAFLKSCRLPCGIPTLPDRDYLLGITAPGYYSTTRRLKRNRSADKPFVIRIGKDLHRYARDVWTCWSDHEKAGFPDTEATPCLRLPPKMPREAKESGHCQVQFDVSAAGWPDNVRTLRCSDPVFAKPTIRSVEQWYYVPETQRGQTLVRQGVTSKVTFRLTDRDGNIIPENGWDNP